MGEFSVTSKKACTKCGEVKWASDFYNLAASPDGRCPRCKECEKARARGWHKGNKARAFAEFKRLRDEAVRAGITAGDGAAIIWRPGFFRA